MEILTNDPVPENEKDAPIDIAPDVLPIKSMGEVTDTSISTEQYAGEVSTIAKETQSPNFVHNISGWRLSSNGRAEFNDIDPSNEMLMGTNTSRPKTYWNFQCPMIGTSAAAIQGAWTASSTDVTFYPSAMRITGTGADRAYHKGGLIYGPRAIGAFNDSLIAVMDYFAILPSGTLDTMIGFADQSAVDTLTITYNQTAQEAICFTQNAGVLYAHVSNATNATTTSLSSIDITIRHNYRIVMDGNTDTAYFYVDGILLTSISTYFPTTSFIGAIIGRTATGQMDVTNPYFSVSI